MSLIMKKVKKTTKAKVSPFKPKFIKNLVPSGFSIFSFHVGFISICLTPHQKGAFLISVTVFKKVKYLRGF